MKFEICRALLLVSAIATFAGCAGQSQSQPQPRMPFPAAEYTVLPTEGTGVVEGQVFMKTLGGDVKYGAGAPVILNPITSYSEEWYRYTFTLHQPLQTGDSRQGPYIKISQADGSGNFRFTDVPPGRYFLTSEVRWQAPSQFGLTPQGGQMADRITVQNGKITRVILTR